jgi:hypothetical protein
MSKVAGPAAPTMEALIRENMELKSRMGARKFKADLPEVFKGEPSRLSAFLTQAQVYLRYQGDVLPYEYDKVLGIASRLGGSAFDWFEPRMKEFLEGDPQDESFVKDLSEETRAVFGTYEGFTSELTKIFGDVDEKKVATRKLRQLRQTGSARSYTAEFRRIMARLDWNDEAFMAQYHEGLKEALKDELVRIDEPDDLQEMMEIAGKVDNRFYERRLQKGGKTNVFTKVHQFQKKNPQGRFTKKPHRQYGDPMELDVITKKTRDKPNRKGKEDWKKGKKCFKCGKPGHFSNECGQMQLNMVRKDPEDPVSNKQLQHAIVSWKACHDDNCVFHQSDKDKEGWYPQPAKRPSAKENHAMLHYTQCTWEYCHIHYDDKKEDRWQRLTATPERIEEKEEPTEEKQAAERRLASVRKTDGPPAIIPHMEFRVKINGNFAVAMIDSGSHGNYIGQDAVEKMKLKWDNKTYPYPISTVDGTSIGKGFVTAETAPVIMRISDKAEEIIFDIAPLKGRQVILGTPWLTEHNPFLDWKKGVVKFTTPDGLTYEVKRHLDTRRHSNELCEMNWQQNQVPAQYHEFMDVFNTKKGQNVLPKHQPWDHQIPLMEGKQPGYEKIYPLNEEKTTALKNYIKENLARGFIRKSTSPAGYPILFVPKPGGEQRLCVDYRKLNAVTIKNRYPLPLMSELQDQIGQAEIFTKLDLDEAYHQVRMKEGEEWKTAFRTKEGHFEYTVMPFGLTNAPASFQTLINEALAECLGRFAAAYLDDIIIYSKNKDTHPEDVKKVLKALRKWNLKVKLAKCAFGVAETTFLGHIMSPGKIRMDPEKVSSITTWPTPKSVRDVQSFLGLANYYRRFIKDFAALARPLTQLTKKDQQFEWTNKCEDTFNILKEKFTTAPVLQIFDPEKRCIVETDASDYAMGACLNQEDNQGRQHPVMYFSRQMQDAELNYDVHDKELLAIIETLRNWRVYLEGAKHQVEVITDHKNLTYFMTSKDLNRRQIRWAEELAYCRPKIVYRKGSENARADALSRRPDYQEIGPRPKQQILKEVEGGLEYNREILALYTVADKVDNEILKAYEKDSMYEELSKAKQPHIHVSADGYLRYYGKVYVPTSQRTRIIEESHDTPVAGHFGFKKTHDKIKKSYYFPQMKKTIRAYIDRCVTCIIDKPSRHSPYGEMGRFEIPSRPWQSIGMDWITKLPKSKDPLTGTAYDSVWVIVCRLTKLGYFIPYLESSTTEALCYSFKRHVIANHGMPENIVSDRDKWLTSKFWTSLMKQLGVKQTMTSGYHPQTNGQTERLNQTLEEYLRHYLNWKQDNWVELLPIAQYAYNSSTTEPTGMTPYEATYGFTPEILHKVRPDEAPAQSALERSTELKETHEQMRKDLEFISYRMAKYYNLGRSSAPIFKEGGKVFIIARNIKTRRPSNKLDHVKLGPFLIKEKIGEHNYRIGLPEGMKKHPVFHVSLLERAPDESKVVTRLRTNSYEEKEYEVERIVGFKPGKRWEEEQLEEDKYLIKWKGYSEQESSWEPESNLNCRQKIEQYHQEQKKKGWKRTSSRATPLTTTPTETPSNPTTKQPRDQVRRLLMIRRDLSPAQPPDAQPPQSMLTREQTFPSPETTAYQLGWKDEDAPREGRDAAPEHERSPPGIERVPTPYPILHPLSGSDGSEPSFSASPDQTLVVHQGISEEQTVEQCDIKIAVLDHLLIEITRDLQDVTKEADKPSLLAELEYYRKKRHDREQEKTRLIMDEIDDTLTKVTQYWELEEDQDKAMEYFEERHRLMDKWNQARRYLQSLSVTTRSHLAPRPMQEEQRPEARSTKQRRLRVRQEEQGEGMAAPRDSTLRANSLRRTDDEVTFGIAGQKRKHQNVTRGDHRHALYPKGNKGQSYTGYRDAIRKKEGVMLKPQADDSDQEGMTGTGSAAHDATMEDVG